MAGFNERKVTEDPNHPFWWQRWPSLRKRSDFPPTARSACLCLRFGYKRGRKKDRFSTTYGESHGSMRPYLGFTLPGLLGFLRLVCFYFCYPLLLKKDVRAIFNAVKVEFFAVWAFSFHTLWSQRESAFHFMRTSEDKLWNPTDKLKVELNQYHRLNPWFRPFIEHYRLSLIVGLPSLFI